MSSRKSHSADSERQCIWVSAGVLSYHLCDRDFDCDRCPLHQALSPESRRPAVADSDWPRNRLYTDRHMWVEQLAGDEVRVGLTSMAAQVLNPVAAWTSVEVNAAVPKDVPLITASTTGGDVGLSLPFDATAVHPNPRIRIDPLWPIADPWESGYLAILHAPQWDRVEEVCQPLDALGGLYSRQRKQIGEMLGASAHPRQEEVKTADGGLPIAGLASVLGARRYRLLLSELFGSRAA